jgi:hypothetical protein
MAAIPMSAETAGYAFTPRQAKITSALEGLGPVSLSFAPATFRADPLSSYALADDKRYAPMTAGAGALADIAGGAIKGYMANYEAGEALKSEERKHLRNLEIEGIKSARSSEALQKRIDYMREAAAKRLEEVGGNKKKPRQLIGGTAIPEKKDASGYAEDENEGGMPPDPNLDILPEDLPPEEPLPELLPVDNPYQENMPKRTPLEQPFRLDTMPAPFVPGAQGTEDIAPIAPISSASEDKNYYIDLSDPAYKLNIDPMKALSSAVASADKNAPAATLPSEAISSVLSELSLAGPVNMAVLPPNRQEQQLRADVRSAAVGSAVQQAARINAAQPTLAAMPAAVAGKAAQEAPLKGLHPDFQSGSFANQEDAFAMQQLPVPEGYNKPQVKKQFDDVAGVDYWEVSMPEPMTQAEKAAIAKSEQAAGPDSDREAKLRKEYLDGSKNYLIVQDAFGNINRAAELAAKNPASQGAADLALIFSYMKLLDPGSTVREGEFANAQNAAGVPQRIQAEYNRLITGGRLGDDQRKEFVRVAKSLYVQRQRAQNQLSSIYSELAKRDNVRPEMVVVDLKTPDPLANLNFKIKQKVQEVQGFQDNPEERQRAFTELQDLIKQQRDLELQYEQEIAVD